MSDFVFSSFLHPSVKDVLSEFMDTLDSSKVSSFESSSDSNWLLTQFFYDGLVHRHSFDILSKLPSYVQINLVSNHGKLRFDFIVRVPYCWTFDSSDVIRCLQCPYCLPPSERTDTCMCNLAKK